MRKLALLLLVTMAFLLVSCNLPLTAAAPTPVPTDSTTDTSPPTPTDTPPPPPSPTDTPVPTPTTDPYANIVHEAMPGNPVLTYYAYDCNTGRYTPANDAPRIGGGCNQWQNNFIEKPVNDQLTLYYPHLDIVRFQMGTDDRWMYAEIQLYAREDAETALTGSYGLELDFDVDGQGDLLVIATDPSAYPAGEWHAMGVQVWEDANNDIGSATLIYADEDHPGDGYDTVLFDQGLGDDPDLAWARISPESANTVQFAFKPSVLQTSGAFVWWTWASQEPLDPALFDYVDSFADEEIYQIENSCRWIYKGPPAPIPNVCPYEEPEPEREPEDRVAYCWVQNLSAVAVFPRVCQVCPDPCPAGYACGGSCTP